MQLWSGFFRFINDLQCFRGLVTVLARNRVNEVVCMSQRGVGKFRQREVTRLVKALAAAGRDVESIQITSEGARVILKQQGSKLEPENPFDAWKDKRDARPA
jgi:hypothetical protein